MRSTHRITRVVLALALGVAMATLGACEAVALPYPPAPADSGVGRRAVYAVEQQRVWLIEADETIVRSYLVSGRAGTPSPGNYNVFSRSRHTTSIGGGARMELMVRFAWGRNAAIGFHSIPVNSRGAPLQTDAELGTYRSAGCVRQNWDDAVAMWDFGQVGTPVVVVK